MSSKIVPADSVRLDAMPWRMTGPGVTPSTIQQPAPQSSTHDSAGTETPELNARIQELENEVRRAAETSYHAGRTEGEAATRQQSEAAVSAAVARLGQAAVEVANLRTQVRREAEEDVVRLAVAIARRVLRRELTIDPEAILGIVKAAFDKIEMREINRIRADTETAALLVRHLNKMSLSSKLEVSSDSNLERGTAIFETTRGVLDASVESQLDEISRGFADMMGRSS